LYRKKVKKLKYSTLKDIEMREMGGLVGTVVRLLATAAFDPDIFQKYTMGNIGKGVR
jgi:hypothetical protein